MPYVSIGVQCPDKPCRDCDQIPHKTECFFQIDPNNVEVVRINEDESSANQNTSSERRPVFRFIINIKEIKNEMLRRFAREISHPSSDLIIRS